MLVFWNTRKVCKPFQLLVQHFPVIRILSPIAFKTQRSNISVTSGCCVWQICFAVCSPPLLCAHSPCHFASSFTHVEIRGCLIIRFGYTRLKCFAVFDWFFPLAWYQLMYWASVAFSLLVNIGAAHSLFGGTFSFLGLSFLGLSSGPVG